MQRGAEHQAADHAEQGGRRGQVAQVDRAAVVAGDDPAPAAVVLVLLGEGAHGGPGPVGDLELRGEPDQSAVLPDAVVQLPVLGADELLVVAALPFQHLAAEHAEVDGVGGAGQAAGVEGGVADADLGGHRGGDGPLPVGLALGVHDAADVGGVHLVQQPYGGGDVTGRQQAVAVDPDDHGVPAGADRRVQAGGGAAGRVGDGAHPRVLGDQGGGDLVGPVGGRAECDHHFQVAVVLLLQDPVDGGAQVSFLVEHRHDHGDRRQLLSSLGVHRARAYRRAAAGVGPGRSRSGAPPGRSGPQHLPCGRCLLSARSNACPDPLGRGGRSVGGGGCGRRARCPSRCWRPRARAGRC